MFGKHVKSYIYIRNQNLASLVIIKTNKPQTYEVISINVRLKKI